MVLGDSFYKPFLTSQNVTLVYNQTYMLLQSAFAGVITSGTATLEAALFHLPQVVCYRANALTVAFAKTFAKVKYISLVNLIADKPVVRELIQKDLNKNTLETEFSKITKDKNNRMTMIAEYESIEKTLGSEGIPLPGNTIWLPSPVWKIIRNFPPFWRIRCAIRSKGSP